MSVLYKVITRPKDPCVPNFSKKCYPHLITLGQCVHLVYLAQKMEDPFSLSISDIKSLIQNFVDRMKEQLQERKSVNIEGLGILRISERPKDVEFKKDIMIIKSVESLHVFLVANRELRISESATDRMLELNFMDDYDEDGSA